MNRRSALAVLAAAALAPLTVPAPASGAVCVRRGWDHIRRHGGRIEDDRWHLMRGEPVTCDQPRGPHDTEDTADREPHHERERHEREHELREHHHRHHHHEGTHHHL